MMEFGGHLASQRTQGTRSPGSRGHRAPARGLCPLHGLRVTGKAVIPAALDTGETRRARTGKSATESPREREPRASAPPARRRGFAGECWGEL